MKRVPQFVLIGTMLALCWLGMQVIHEWGHACAATFSGGQVSRVVLTPLEFSRTEFDRNPHPLFVAWAGPVWGSVMPVVWWAVMLGLRSRRSYLVRFFAGFCLIANGAYLAAGWYGRVGDAGVIRSLGTPVWVMVGVGGVAMVAGLALWNRLGESFGLGPARGRVRLADAIFVPMLLALIVGYELLPMLLAASFPRDSG